MLSRWLGLSALVVVLDQISKLWVSNNFVYGEHLPVFKGFNLV